MSSSALEKIRTPLVCSGSAFERGKIQGTALKQALKLCFNAFFQSEAFAGAKPAWLPDALAIPLSGWQARRQFLPALRQLMPDFWAQIQGLAAGSELPLNYFLLACAAELLLARTDFQLGGCSALTIPEAFSASEEPVLVKNFDYPYFLRGANLVRKTIPESGMASLDVTLVPLPGCHTGLNEAGVAITYNYGYGQTAPVHWLPLTLRVQEALRTCETAEEVIAFFKTGVQAGGAIMTVLDATGAIWLLEIASDLVEARLVHQNLLMATNHYQLPELMAVDIPLTACYPQTHAVSELAGKRIHESSEARLDRLSALTGTKIQFHEDELKACLRDHNRRDSGSDNTVCRHGQYFETTCSVLIKPRSREIQVAQGNPCEESYHVFRF
jgi:hypothetical protein